MKDTVTHTERKIDKERIFDAESEAPLTTPEWTCEVLSLQVSERVKVKMKKDIW